MSNAVTASLSRQISFSCGLRLNQSRWHGEKNLEYYGKYSRLHGANFQLHVSLCGLISPKDGMIVNLINVKPYLAQVVQPLDGSFLNNDVVYFSHHSPTPENVAQYLWGQMPSSIGSAMLYKLALHQDSRVSVEMSANTMKVSRSYEFAAAHRLFTPNLYPEENWAKFDKCSNPAGHGHNYQLFVWVEGVPDPESGYIINPSLLDEIVENEVYQRFDHRHLNEDCSEFFGDNLVPTTENLTLVIFQLLREQLNEKGYQLSKIGLQETQKNYFEVEA